MCYGDGARNCTPDTYVFEAQPGLAYVLRGPAQTIVMLDRFKKTPLGELYPTARHAFVSQQEWTAMRNGELAAAPDAGRCVGEQRQRDQPMVRKVGAHVYQEAGRDIIYSGYVEKVANDQLQIRIAEAHFKGSPSLRPSRFTAKTVWEPALQWDLCK